MEKNTAMYQALFKEVGLKQQIKYNSCLYGNFFSRVYRGIVAKVILKEYNRMV